MLRWFAVSLLGSSVLIACGGSNRREVSKLRYTHGDCSDCGIEPSAEPRFELPDADRRVPENLPQADIPVEPTCKLVAETLVAFELGNYAEPEVRAPKIAQAERRCATMKISRDDRQCVVDSPDRASAAYCVPALFPGEPVGEPLDAEQCKSIADTMRVRFEHLSKGQQPKQRAMLERELGTAIEACRADRWNTNMAQCASQYIPMHSQYCAHIQPYAMYKRLERRLEKARE